MVLQTITKEQAHLHIDPDKISYEIVRHGYDPRILHMISPFFFVLVDAQKSEQNLVLSLPPSSASFSDANHPWASAVTLHEPRNLTIMLQGS